MILFCPFSLKKWRYLILISLLAGALTGGFNGSGLRNSGPKKEVLSSSASGSAQVRPSAAQSSVAGSKSSQRVADPKNVTSDFLKKTWKWWVLGSVLLFALMYLISWYLLPCKFVWFDSIVKNDSSFWEPYRRYRKEGNRLFVLSIYMTFVFLAILAVCGIVFFLLAQSQGVFNQGFQWSLARGARVLAAPVLLLVISMVFLIIFSVMWEDFVIPIMAVDSCGLGKAWGAFLEVYKENKKDFWLYLLVKMGLGILCGILALLANVLVLLVFLVAGALLFGVSYLIFAVLLKAKIVFFILAILMALPFLFVLIYSLLATGLPFAVFFRSLSLYFFSGFKTRYQFLPVE